MPAELWRSRVVGRNTHWRQQECWCVQRKIPQQSKCEDQGHSLRQHDRWEVRGGTSPLTLKPPQPHNAYRGSGARSSCGSRYSTWIRVVILYHSMVSTPPTAFVCGYPRQHRLLCSTLTYHASALVSPWINNGNALAYVKNHDRLVNYKNLVHLLFATFVQKVWLSP